MIKIKRHKKSDLTKIFGDRTSGEKFGEKIKFRRFVQTEETEIGRALYNPPSVAELNKFFTDRIDKILND